MLAAPSAGCATKRLPMSKNTRRVLHCLNRPPDGLTEEIARLESKRLGLDYGDSWAQLDSAYKLYVENYSTDSPGYVGPVLVVLWPASPAAVSTYIKKDGQWKHCSSSAW
jgi:hypothetical protein